MNLNEVMFWVNTNKSPCLYNFNNKIKKHFDDPRSRTQRSLPASLLRFPRRPLSHNFFLRNDLSTTTDSQGNVSMITTHSINQQNPDTVSDSETFNSYLDFYINKYSNKKKNTKPSTSRGVPKQNNITSPPTDAGPLRRGYMLGRNHTITRPESDSTETQNRQSDDSEYNRTALVPKPSTAMEDNNRYGEPSTFKKMCCSFVPNQQRGHSRNVRFDEMSDLSSSSSTYVPSSKLQSSKKIVRLKTKTQVYNKRQKNSSAEDIHVRSENNNQGNKVSLNKRIIPEELLISRTRSGRCYGFYTGTSSTEPASSVASNNNTQSHKYSGRRKKATKVFGRKQKKSGRKESHRKQSDFTTSFSDSDDDSI